MLLSTIRVVLACLLAIVLIQPVRAADSDPHYHVAGRIAGPDGLWDYASVDAAARRLYVGKAGGIVAIDLKTERVIPAFYASPVVHQVLPIGKGRLLATTGDSNKAVILDGTTGKLIADVPTGDEPDAIAYDAKTGRAITLNRRGRDTTIFDVETARVVGGFKLPGAPEFAVSDGKGVVYVNIADKSRIAVIDLARGAITRTIVLKNCEAPSGLALDARTGLLLAACENGVVKVVTTLGREVAGLPIGKAPDAVFVDERRRLAFVPCGGDGTLAVISIAAPDKVSVVENLRTVHAARTGAVDSETGIVYLPFGKVIPPIAPAKWPSVVPGSFEILVVRPEVTVPRR
jgi:DNA-binding beta-propeller fold protein YncE